jgi:hypothetical protein
MAVSLLTSIIPEFLINGIPAVGAQLFTYAAGSTTKQATYTDATGLVAQTNPIVLNARGEPQNQAGNSVGIWLTQGLSYKFVLAPATDTDPPTAPIWTIDNVTQSLLTGSSYSAAGGNAITLTPLPGTGAITAYANYQQFSFVAPATLTGAATLQVGSLGYLPLYVNGQQASTNTITAGQLVVCQYVSSLGAGGAFVAIPTQNISTVLTAADTGAANAYVINPSPAPTSYAVGQFVAFFPANSNTGASTINVSSLGAKSIITTDGLSLATPGQIKAGGLCLLSYDGTYFQLVNSQFPWRAPTSADSGTANAYVALSVTPAVNSLYVGLEMQLEPAHTNTGAATFTVGAFGTIAIRRTDLSALQAGDIVAGGIYQLVYDGTYWQLINPTPTVNRVVARAAFTVSGGVLTTTFLSGVASITRSSAGVYVVTFNSNVVPDANYAVALGQAGAGQVFFGAVSKTSSGFTINSVASGGAATDGGGLDVIVVR